MLKAPEEYKIKPYSWYMSDSTYLRSCIRILFMLVLPSGALVRTSVDPPARVLKTSRLCSGKTGLYQHLRKKSAAFELTDDRCINRLL